MSDTAWHGPMTSTGSWSAPASAAPSRRCGWPRRATGSRCSSAAAASATRTSPSPPGNLRRYFWAPKLGLRGVLRMTFFKDVFVVSGCGVGGGSLGYANTLYRARPAFFADPQWGELGDWERELAPHYDTAERMLGVAELRGRWARPTSCCRSTARRSASARPSANTRVGVFFGEPGERGPRPLLRRRGAARGPAACAAAAAWSAAATAPRTRWSRTTSGSPRSSASRSMPERQVTEIRPLGRRRRLRRLRGRQRALGRLARASGAGR